MVGMMVLAARSDNLPWRRAQTQGWDTVRRRRAMDVAAECQLGSCYTKAPVKTEAVVENAAVVKTAAVVNTAVVVGTAVWVSGRASRREAKR
jgi:hypothetical protein